MDAVAVKTIPRGAPMGNGALKTEDQRWLTVVGARHNNLKNVTVSIPLSRFVCITGVSGSGKSSLVNDILREQLARDLNGAENVQPGRHDRILGARHLDKLVDIDQSPIGRTPRSNPGTYIKVFDEIRDLFSRLPDSKVRGYKPGRFSFNVATGPKGGGRCEACEGNGSNKVEMDFLADVWVTCPVCRGHRFSKETLQILFKGKSVSDVLDMEVAQALEHFQQVPQIAAMLKTLHDVGLDYLKIGQSSTTLSGGEAQRIKLARELVRKSTGRTLYLLDEPTTGLHFDDIKRLLGVLHGFVDAGNSVVVIEHNLDVIKTADWVIDLGPEGGERGGYVIAQGSPEEIVATSQSHTAVALQGALRESAAPRRPSSAVRGGDAPRRLEARRPMDITIVGARQHNLKDVNVSVPRGKTSVFCGPSGSGKTSLALDTIYAEGQRRYVESLSAYARQFLGRIQKPRVDHIEGLSPAIAIDQKSASKSPRSTVGTVTEVYDYLRVLWARLGHPHCPRCRALIGSQTIDEIVERILEFPAGTRALLLAPVEPSDGESYEALFDRERGHGYTRVRVDGTLYRLGDSIPVERRRKHRVEIAVDRIVVRTEHRPRLADSVEQALSLGSGVLIVAPIDETPDGAAPRPNAKTRTRHRPAEMRFSQRHACRQCGQAFEELTPHHFSFNSRMGWCPVCEGLGTQLGASPASVVVHPARSLLDGALAGWENAAAHPAKNALLGALASHLNLDPRKPWNQLSEADRIAVLQGAGDSWMELPRRAEVTRYGLAGVRFRWRGFFPAIDRATRASWEFRQALEDHVTEVPCDACAGSRLRPEARLTEVGGRTLGDVCRLPLDAAVEFFSGLELDRREKRIAGELLHEICSRLRFLIDVGLEYVSLHRPAPTLSGGEAQRIRLASQVGSGLTGVLYVLDEPTIGLHPRDNARLIGALRKLRDLGNTVILVEHDRDVIEQSDCVYDFGPGAGADGGNIVASGTPAALRSRRASLTGRYLSGKASIPVPSNRREVVDDGRRRVPEHWLEIEGARHNNLADLDVSLPLGRFVAVTGVSGSGKSSLISDTLHPALASRFHRARLTAGAHRALRGTERIDKVINVDQSPLGTNPSSNPATYTGLFDLLRELFAKLPESKVRGYTANRFSFNRPGGRCEACEGMGQRCIEMHFLPDVWVDCESCGGSRYLPETLEIRYRGKSIADTLAMRVSDALSHFEMIPKLRHWLQVLEDVGLGYIQLGQPAPTLSGGEAQRVRLAAELGRPSTGKTLYLLDEPTTGLHFDDLQKLLRVLHRLVDLGNTVLCVEHNLEVIKTADHVIDLGPEAGALGGRIVAVGTPEQVAANEQSYTGRALQPILAAGPLRPRERFDVKSQAALERALAAPLRLSEAKLTKAPWEADGRRWHTVGHLDRRGHTVEWDTKVLEWLVETVEQLGDFEPADWNDRVRVEIKARGSSAPWFAHFLTGGHHLLEVTLRVPARHFQNKTVVQALGVKTLDERADLPIYGQWSRVTLRAAGRAFDDIHLHLRDFKDVDKTVFRTFLKQAVDAFFLTVREQQTDPVKGQPWKTDGRKWHLSQQSIRRGQTVLWRPEVLLELVGKLNKLAADLEFDYSAKSAVSIRRSGVSKSLGKIVTNLAAGLRCEIRTPRNQFTPGQVDGLGTLANIVRGPQDDLVVFRLTTLEEINWGQLAILLARTAELAAS